MKSMFMLGILAVFAIVTTGAYAVETVVLKTEAIRHVTEKEAIEALVKKDKRFKGLEVNSVEVETSGELNARKFKITLNFSTPLGEGDKGTNLNCDVVATTSAKVVAVGPPVVGGPTVPVTHFNPIKYSDIECAQ